ncbi:MAG: glycine--tRNA ligase [Flavobacteriales bacterium]|nr:glycine--tRNA ligase [Flavobacteriales bacterium]|tara:strand:+ start:63588 stop:65123 length:1536 start_codon:yes stop_codon:yes gene_type:complete
MANYENIFKKVVAHCKEYGYIFQSSEIYDGLAATYDYGPNGVELKNNIKNYWWKSMVNMHENIVGLDSAIFMHPTTWKASGHTDAFNDPLIDNKDSKKRYRADILIEDYIAKIEVKIEKDCLKASKRFGDAFNKQKFITTNSRVLDRQKQIDIINSKMNAFLSKGNLKDVKKLIEELDIKCPISGTNNWTDVRQFNLMFKTQIGAASDNSSDLYLRPETAQGIFVNFLNVQKTTRMKIPFGIAQIGKAFRNEIIARQFIFRMREFEQMEMQFFIRPGEEIKWYKYWKDFRMKWHTSLGMGEDNYRFHDHETLAHYANAATDIEFKFPFGFKELEGIHSRTDFDLKAHQECSGKKLQYFDPELEENYVPYVLETSIGLDRMFLAILSSSFTEEKLENGENRVVLNIPPILSPIKAAILPLTKKDNLPEKAREIMKSLQIDFNCQYEEKDSIGKRYRRQDAIGTPYCITVDHQTLKDNTITLRDRTSMKQERISIEKLHSIIAEKVNISRYLG